MMLEKGQVIAGKYTVERYIGKGTMTEVYEAQQTTLKKTVALKVLFPEIAKHNTILKRFVAEVNAVSSLEAHPNVVWISDLDKDGIYIFFVLDYYESSLRALLDAGGKLPVDRCVEITADILKGLSYAHSYGILHRDVKPSNILIDDSGGGVLSDFGLGEVAREAVRQLKTTKLLPSPIYLSPEHIRTPDAIDNRADIYSVGVALYEALTGKTPFFGDVRQIYSQKFIGKLTRPSRLVPDVPEWLEQVVLTALEKDRVNRYAIVEEMRRALLREEGRPTQRSDVTETRNLPGRSSVVTGRGVSLSEGGVALKSLKAPLVVGEGEIFEIEISLEGSGLISASCEGSSGVSPVGDANVELQLGEGGKGSVKWSLRAPSERGEKRVSINLARAGNNVLDKPFEFTVFVGVLVEEAPREKGPKKKSRITSMFRRDKQ